MPHAGGSKVGGIDEHPSCEPGVTISLKQVKCQIRVKG